MGKIEDYKKAENIGWKFFEKTGDINAYGMVVSSRELAKEKLFEQEQENIKSITQSLKNPGMFPNQVVRASKIMNMVTSLHLKELYGMNFLNYYKPLPITLQEYL